MLQPPGPDVLRDEWGRPLVCPPSGRGRAAYRRVTTFVSVLEDSGGLRRWEQRQLAIGLSRRPDLVLAAATVNPAQATGRRDHNDPGRQLLDDIVARATEHASAAATTGTSLHALTERLDRCEQVYVPEAHRADLAAYQKATAGIEWTAIETFRVLDGWKVAGTADRIGRYRGRLVIADIKTGSIDYPHKFAMQLAVYAHSLPYDIASDRRGPADIGLDLRRGLIIHLPAGLGKCDLYEVDIEKGWEACQLAHQVWQWRSTKGLLTPAESASGTLDFTRAACAAPDIETLREVWWEAKAANSLNTDLLETIEKRRQELAANNNTAERR